MCYNENMGKAIYYPKTQAETIRRNKRLKHLFQADIRGRNKQPTQLEPLLNSSKKTRSNVA
jgi:hypothetical protein